MVFLHHSYVWTEAVSRDDITANLNIRLTRLTVDVLLFGPTEMNQVEVQVDTEKDPTAKTLKIIYRPPTTYLSAKRTAIRMAGHMGATVDNIKETGTTLSASSRVQSHENELIDSGELAKQKEIVEFIDLPFPCDTSFCTRDDWGRPNLQQGVTIGMYGHDSADFRSNNQHVWILHVEMTKKERAKTTPVRPTSYDQFFQYA